MTSSANTRAGVNFGDRLADAIDRAGSVLCVGLDPVLERLPSEVTRDASPADAIGAFSRGVIDAVCEGVGAGPAGVKPQAACFERYGADGVRELHATISHARSRGLLVILDAKRGDIGVTAEHYAAATFAGEAGADAVTLNGYMGADTIEPFFSDSSRGVFVLVRTSNPGSDELQSMPLASGETVAQRVGEMVARLGASRVGSRGLSSVGAVVGATKSSEAAALRRIMPNQFFLVPGYGAQGGSLDDVRVMTRQAARSPGELGVIVNASRSVIYPAAQPGESWQAAIRRAAMTTAGELRALR
jgi:orotidine-5'-phosphate decarboxylase